MKQNFICMVQRASEIDNPTHCQNFNEVLQKSTSSRAHDTAYVLKLVENPLTLRTQLHTAPLNVCQSVRLRCTIAHDNDSSLENDKWNQRASLQTGVVRLRQVIQNAGACSQTCLFTCLLRIRDKSANTVMQHDDSTPSLKSHRCACAELVINSF